MTLDRHAAERRRFARLLGVDGELGSGLPIGDPDHSVDDRTNQNRARDDQSRTGVDTDTEAESVSAPTSGTEGPT
ncbi:hypothetical protein [Halopiger xanaduensis]|uniref:Uncharacterized protein n=1 Tax=Halopiger xanaduensis (strain DSM 18323 / JCM 14033 / SH-6) TaxID=797210 RepID=F8D6E6_HALXS|nr:hypothetical protein [Halopiger xanaduensis]AEH36533.1 hypothetical protein Halxa_1906 [Halopiger xanaduensis SH-6]